jgi:hypothetical protein
VKRGGGTIGAVGTVGGNRDGGEGECLLRKKYYVVCWWGIFFKFVGT